MPATIRNDHWHYRVVVQLKDGTKQRISGKPALNTKAAALEAEKAHIQRLLNPPQPAPIPPEAFSVFAAEWLKTYPAAVGNRPSTIRASTLHVTQHLIPLLGDTLLSAIDAKTIMSVFAKLRETEVASRSATAENDDDGEEEEKRACLAASTIKNITQTLHKILVCAHQWGKLPQGLPVWPKLKVETAPFDFYTSNESQLLLAACDAYPEDRALILFALRTGVRAGEQAALEWGDVDFANHQIRITRSIHQGNEGPTKSGRGRVLPMSPALETALRGIKHLRGEKVFCQADGTPWELWHLTARLRRAARLAGLRALHWHCLRHSFASQSMICGFPLKQVQEWLGHATILMTMRYAHLAPNTDKVAMVSLLDAEGESR